MSKICVITALLLLLAACESERVPACSHTWLAGNSMPGGLGCGR